MAHTVPRPMRSATQRRLTRFGRQELVHLRQSQRQTLLGQWTRHTVGVVVDREWFAPVALAAEDGVAQAVVHLDPAQPFVRDVALRSCDGFGYIHAVQHESAGPLLTSHWRVDHAALFGIETLLGDVATLDQRNDGQIEMACEGIVATVVRGDGHDGARAVASQHVVADPDRDLLARQRIDGVRATEDARHLMVGNALALRASLDRFEIRLHVGPLRVGCESPDVFALRRQHHEGNAEDGVCPRGEDLQRLRSVGQREEHLGTLAAADPVALRLLE